MDAEIPSELDRLKAQVKRQREAMAGVLDYLWAVQVHYRPLTDEEKVVFKYLSNHMEKEVKLLRNLVEKVKCNKLS